MSASPKELLDAALHYASMGYKVFPCWGVKEDGTCACGGRPGCTPGKHPLIDGGFKNASKDEKVIRAWWARWPNANIGLPTGEDFDAIDTDPRHGGNETILELQAQHGRLPDTVQSLTGGGGDHRLFHCGASMRSSDKLGPGVDFKGVGGYIIAPPSNHASGRQYEWEASSVLGEVPLAELPDWVQKIVGSTNGTGKQRKAGTRIKEGDRHETLKKKAAQMRRGGMSEEEINAALLGLRDQLAEPGKKPVSDDEIASIAEWFGQREGNTSAPTDDELADEWLSAHPGTAYGLGDFRRYEAGVWPVLPKGQVEEEILAVLEAGKLHGVKPSAWKLRSVFELARIKATVPDVWWNADPDLIVCQNGTLQISTRTLRPHSPEDHITSALPYGYDPKASADVLKYCLETTVPDAAGFLQEFAGYSLTTMTMYELAVWLYGPAGSGKSTFIEGLRAMLGNRVGDLGLADIERSRFALGDLPDKTLMVSAEQPAAFMERSYLLNAIISGESVTIDRKYREQLTLQPHVKILWAMNELPRIPEASNGLFRRVKVVKFPPLMGAPDPRLKEAIKLEGAGILNWALDGLDRLKWQGGFDVPACVTDATSEFQAANDVPAAFLQERCVREPAAKVPSNKLYQEYRAWCLDGGHKPQSRMTIATDWERLRLVKTREESGVFWYGARLRAV